MDLVAQANAARYQDAFNAPAPFGDEPPKSRNGNGTPARKNIALYESAPDLDLGKSLNGIGNALANRLTGNDQNNILDGMAGADTMIGGKGDDSYYVDNSGDKVIEQADEGVDTVYATVSSTLSANVENLVLLDSSKPQTAVVHGVDVLVYGMPRSYQLDYAQGYGVPDYLNTSGETSIANLTLIAGHPVSEKEVVERAIKEEQCDTISTSPDNPGGTNAFQRQALLHDFGLDSTIDQGFDVQAVAQSIKDGKGVIVSVSAGKLWGIDMKDDNISDHVITVTGVACSADHDKVVGFYIADSGRGTGNDICRFMTTQQLIDATNVQGATTITTDDPIKLRDQNLDATGNELDNILVGNRGDNVITGGKGNDMLIGGAGNDTYRFASGDGQDVVYDHDATKGNLDTLQFSDAKQTNLWFSQAGDDLKINVMGSKDQVTVKDWYVGGDSGTDNHIERIKTADGKTLYDTDVAKLVQAMASFSTPSATQTSWPTTPGSNGKVLLTVTH
ncbi:calcium-binding protein [Herbaspirillum sp. NPDC087042]|uniref:calcium-binding protein n=1 Tax=Herbaspirillum sp. NPDC087042 TaxID=3364004 RepID=UPI00381025E2